jgi:hypothetical protein
VEQSPTVTHGSTERPQQVLERMQRPPTAPLKAALAREVAGSRLHRPAARLRRTAERRIRNAAAHRPQPKRDFWAASMVRTMHCAALALAVCGGLPATGAAQPKDNGVVRRSACSWYWSHDPGQYALTSETSCKKAVAAINARLGTPNVARQVWVFSLSNWHVAEDPALPLSPSQSYSPAFILDKNFSLLTVLYN